MSGVDHRTVVACMERRSPDHSPAHESARATCLRYYSSRQPADDCGGPDAVLAPPGGPRGGRGIDELAYGERRLLTFNTADFRRYGDRIELVGS